MRKSAKTLSRRVLGAILALCMLVGLLPMTAFAAAPQVPYADWDGTTEVGKARGLSKDPVSHIFGENR